MLHVVFKITTNSYSLGIVYLSFCLSITGTLPPALFCWEDWGGRVYWLVNAICWCTCVRMMHKPHVCGQHCIINWNKVKKSINKYFKQKVLLEIKEMKKWVDKALAKKVHLQGMSVYCLTKCKNKNLNVNDHTLMFVQYFWNSRNKKVFLSEKNRNKEILMM